MAGMRTAEFDAFGPWVMQVVAEEGVPRLYRDHPIDFDAVRMVLKVPRNILRRDASPEMHLYDHLLVADHAGLTVLSRHDDAYTTLVVPYARVAAVHTSVVLLDGLFRLYDVDGTAANGVAIDLPFNGVSLDVVEQLARVVRREALATAPARSLGQPGGAPLRPELDDLGRTDVALISSARELTAKEELVVWAMHHRLGVQRRAGMLGGLTSVIFPPTVHAALVGATSGEVHLVHRRPWVTTGRKPVHSVAHTVITASRVDRVEVSDHPGFTDTQLVRVVSGRAVVELPVPAGAPTIDALLTLLGARVS